MSEIGEKIKEFRKAKGWSQEELAESAKVNLRTIQRIESNESEPRGKTLNLICDALNITAQDVLNYGKQTNKNYLIYFQLSVLSFLVIPIGNLILPLILWMIKKDKIVGLKDIGVNLLNYQIIWTALTYTSLMLYGFFRISYNENFKFLFYLFLGLYVLNIIIPVYCTIQTANGKTKNLYPNIVRLIK